MVGPAPKPGWVISDLMEVIGLDKETVETMIAPDLDNYTQETRLRSHLQDFLGPSPKAKAFTERYLAFRFPSLASSSKTSAPPSQIGSDRRTNQPGRNGIPAPQPARTAQPQSQQNTKALNLDDLNARFGTGGKLYQKNRDADDASSWAPARPASGSGSGVNTPGRPAGAVTFSEAKPKRIDHSSNNAGGKGKQAEKIWDMPKSPAVRKLEGIIGDLRGLQNSEGKVRKDDDHQDCFCQARKHSLSRYTPHCPLCGLILCSLQKPHHPCPSCNRNLQTPAQLARLIQQVQSEVEDQLALEQSQQEQDERIRLERLALELGGGSFPILPGASHVPTPQTIDTGRKVLTIAGKGKGKGKSSATLTTTYSRPTPTPSRPATPPPTDHVPRPRSPPLDLVRGEKDLQKQINWRDTEDRPWGDMKLVKRGGWNYMERAVLELVEEDKIGRRRRRGKENVEKGMGVDGRMVVGAGQAKW